MLDIDVTIAVERHQITQARAVGNGEILTVNAAVGDRPDVPSGQFPTMPAVPPGELAPRTHRFSGEGWVNDQLEERLVKVRPLDTRDGTPGDGQSIIWARIPEVITGIDGARLGILGDFVPSGSCSTCASSQSCIVRLWNR